MLKRVEANLLIAVRHGSTVMNAPEGERSRGWLPIPLDKSGMQGMADTADSLSDVEGIHGIYTSDLVRAVQSAHEIARVHGMEIQPTHQLRDWNLGDFAGQPIKQILPATHALIDHPEQPAPNGESYNDFLNRTIPFLKQLVESPHTNVAVVHNRITTLLHAMSMTGGQEPHVPTLKQKGPVEPSGLMIMDPSWNVKYLHKPTLPDETVQ